MSDSGYGPGSVFHKRMVKTLFPSGDPEIVNGRKLFEREPPLDDWWVESNFTKLAKLEAMGYWEGVHHFMETRSFKFLEKYADDVIMEKISAVRERLRVAKEYETLHGVSSLLIRDHPDYIRMETRRNQPKDFRVIP